MDDCKDEFSQTAFASIIQHKMEDKIYGFMERDKFFYNLTMIKTNTF